MTGPLISLVDCHTHTQPSPAAAREFYDYLELDPGHRFAGTVDELLETMDRAAIARSMLVPWLPAQDLVARRVEQGVDWDQARAEILAQWSELNRWATASVAAHPDRLSCLVGVDPILMEAGEMAREIAERLAAGACGLKIAPKFLGVRPDSEEMEPFWRLARDHGVFVLSESGAVPYKTHAPFGHPQNFELVLESYPTVKIQLAHLGMGAETDVARLASRFSNVFTDLSFRLRPPADGGLTPEDLAALIERIGVERVVFGTNYPLVDQQAYTASFRSLPLSEEELHLVGHKNAEGLFGRCT